MGDESVFFFLKWAFNKTSDLKYFSQSISQPWKFNCELNRILNVAPFAWPMKLVFRFCIVSRMVFCYLINTNIKSPEHSGHSRGSTENSISFVFFKPLTLENPGVWFGSLCSYFQSRLICVEICLWDSDSCLSVGELDHRPCINWLADFWFN